MNETLQAPCFGQQFDVPVQFHTPSIPPNRQAFLGADGRLTDEIYDYTPRLLFSPSMTLEVSKTILLEP